MAIIRLYSVQVVIRMAATYIAGREVARARLKNAGSTG
jgi:hypothetical protein